MSLGLEKQTLIITLLLLFLFCSYTSLYIVKGLFLQEVAKSQSRDDYWFAWFPIINNYLLIKTANGNEMFLISYALSFIPFLGSIFSMLFLLYNCYLTYKLLSRYGVNALLVSVGFIIWSILFVCYLKAYKNLKNNIN